MQNYFHLYQNTTQYKTENEPAAKMFLESKPQKKISFIEKFLMQFQNNCTFGSTVIWMMNYYDRSRFTLHSLSKPRKILSKKFFVKVKCQDLFYLSFRLRRRKVAIRNSRHSIGTSPVAEILVIYQQRASDKNIHQECILQYRKYLYVQMMIVRSSRSIYIWFLFLPQIVI